MSIKDVEAVEIRKRNREESDAEEEEERERREREETGNVEYVWIRKTSMIYAGEEKR